MITSYSYTKLNYTDSSH